VSSRGNGNPRVNAFLIARVAGPSVLSRPRIGSQALELFLLLTEFLTQAPDLAGTAQATDASRAEHRTPALDSSLLTNSQAFSSARNRYRRYRHASSANLNPLSSIRLVTWAKPFTGGMAEAASSCKRSARTCLLQISVVLLDCLFRRPCLNIFCCGPHVTVDSTGILP